MRVRDHRVLPSGIILFCLMSCVGPPAEAADSTDGARITPAPAPAASVPPVPVPAPAPTPEETRPKPAGPGHLETPVPAPSAPVDRSRQPRAPSTTVSRGKLVSVQVNVDASGNDILGDAANEPSLAIDPTDPRNIVAGWRQFDTITDSFRQAGYAYSRDGGKSWTFPGVLQPGQFRSDPVLAADLAGTFYYYSLSTTTTAEMFISNDKGATWVGPLGAQGGDKNWLAVDATGGVGDGHVYPIWNSQFTCCAAGTDYGRSIDGGFNYQGPYATPQKPKWGTIAVGPDGEVYMVGTALDQSSHVLLRSNSARDPGVPPTFELARTVNLGGTTEVQSGPNPGGLLGQVWVAVDHSTGPTRGNVYVLGSVNPAGADPLDVNIIRSTDGGQTWSAPVRVNDEPTGSAYQWFGSLSVAPDGRLDVIWNDTRNDPAGVISELYYAYSTDAGATWSQGLPVSPAFDPTVGYPQQNKIGDYYQIVSDADGGAVIYSATFTGQQNVYFLRVGDCNGNGRHDGRDIALATSADCNANRVPDECEPDCNGNRRPDGCDITLGGSQDCDGNTLPDECDIAAGAADCNADGRIDACGIRFNMETNEGWIAGVAGDTATSGQWTRVDPNGTDAQPENDHTPNGTQCYVTGQGAVGGPIGAADVDGGRTTLVSPVINMASLVDPRVGYWRWYSNDKGSAPGADVFIVEISNNGGTSWVRLETVGPTGPGTVGGWRYSSARVADFVTPTANVRLRFIADDAGTGSIIEAAVDDVSVTDCASCSGIAAPGEPLGLTAQRRDTTLADLAWTAVPGAASYDVYRGAAANASDLACLQARRVPNATTDDGQLPAPGGSLFYVVGARNCAGTSGLGNGRVPAVPCP